MRKTGQLGPDEQASAVKTIPHANTPTVVHLDPLNRAFLITVDNEPEGKYSTQLKLDIQGNHVMTRDANSRVTESRIYDLLGNCIYSASMEIDSRWTLLDANEKKLYVWDSRNYRQRLVYDAARRLIQTNLQQGQQMEVMIEKTVYEEASQDGYHHNRRGRVFQVFDQAGVDTHIDYDFKGNLLSSQRQFAEEYKTTLD